MEKNKRWPVFGPAPVTFVLIFVMIFADFFGGDIVPFDQWMQQFSSSQVEEETPPQSPLARLVRGKDRRKLETTGFACDVAEHSIVCLADLPVRINTKNNITVYDSSSHKVQEETSVKPYALQKDKYLLQYITPVRIVHGDNQPPVCQYNHEVPAVIFSSGISGNIFHEFNDILIPLFITTKHFQSRVFIILEDYDPSFVAKYRKIFSRMSSYEVMNPAANRSVHCFPGMILGLKYHDNLALNPSDIPGGYSIHDFRLFLGETYGLKFTHVSQIRRPTLMFISREKTRKILNEDEMITMMKELGFRVIVATAEEARNVNKFANTVNSCSVLVGAHGAGLTNELFLSAGAVMVQVEPLGLEWAAAKYYGNPAPGMHVHYLRYLIEPEESSLTELYGRHHSVITDPESVYAKGYREVRAVYLDQQDVRVNIVRFRKTILQALKLVKNASLTR
ncbi:Alpha-1,3-arabinosyltransferase XAT3 [Sesamum alatum]|uniref:Alpha-1,3-arabinosyltransferase XAT3 n=1 Tax=Sesamum alatum TaxID=300844 RepID=A0AAE1Z088_9LAMI|nr:Alpha-1,3-arabinosyltransferase XAT3 [Sesamum alatum]